MVTNDETYIVNLCDRVLNSKASSFYAVVPERRAAVPRFLLMPTTKVSHWSSSIGNGNTLSRHHSWIGGRRVAGATGESSERFTTDAKSTVLRKHRIPLVVLDYPVFQCTGQGRLRRNAPQDEAVIRTELSKFLPQE
jgi:hypothetical protein